MKTVTALSLALLIAVLFAACTPDVQAMNGQQIEQRYGVSGAYGDTIATPDGQLRGTVVPISIADGRPGHLIIPEKQANEPHAVYLRDEQGIHPVQLRDNESRDELARSPSIVETRPETEHANKRSWEKDAVVIGGSAGAGTAIGALADGKKGAGVGAAAGGVGGLIYDLATRNRK
jgi:hypothetical protein